MLCFPAIGVWRPGEITVSWRESSRPTIPELELHIERAWNDALARPGVHLFDGPMCRLEKLDAQPGAMHLTLSRTSYRIFTGTNLGHAHVARTYGRDALANPVGLSTLLVSDDGFLMMGRRNASVAYYPNRVHPFSGCLEPGEAFDSFSGARRELREELSLDDSDISELVCIGIAEDASLLQPEMIFAARSKLPRTRIESQLDAGEHLGTWTTPADRAALESAIQSNESFTPVGLAALLLWGRTAFGDNWFVANRADRV